MKTKLPKPLWITAIVLFSVCLLFLLSRLPGLDLITGMVTADIRLAFQEKTEPSYDGNFELKSKSKFKDVQSLYFYITKAGEKDPLLISDCEYRLFDFEYLGWGMNTDNVWAVSADIGTYCYVYKGNDTWKKYGLTEERDDKIWVLHNDENDNDLIQIKIDNIPKKVIDYLN
jgi:hypothetical protein